MLKEAVRDPIKKWESVHGLNIWLDENSVHCYVLPDYSQLYDFGNFAILYDTISVEFTYFTQTTVILYIMVDNSNFARINGEYPSIKMSYHCDFTKDMDNNNEFMLFNPIGMEKVLDALNRIPL